ncbi:MAG: Fic family protein [Lachnospiraceae bacterium]|nr:Fic family protein [Lachnospiraceae bacterium]
MADNKYCYPNSNVLINKLDIKDMSILQQAERDYTFARLLELQKKPLKGKFDFAHLKEIHRYIFQDLYEWAGKTRCVNISKGNSEFCLVQNIDSFAATIFPDFFNHCYNVKDDRNEFVRIFTSFYGEMNALHPFREGNGRTQREFARELCMKCGYVFDLSHTCHSQMLEASVLSFMKADNSKLQSVFDKSIILENDFKEHDNLNILSIDDLDISKEIETYTYYE